MATTTNFGWETPDDSDLVKDGAAAMRTLGNSIDASMADLRGGTTGQILSKNSNTDMDFTWIANDQGDITAVTAGTGISGGGTSGAVTITNSMATEITAKGDLIVGTGNATFDNLPVGTNGYVLTADSTVSPTGLKWAAPAGGGKVLQVVQGTYATETANSTTTYADTGLTATITPSATSSKILVMYSIMTAKGSGNSENAIYLQLLRGATNLGEQSNIWRTGTTLMIQAVQSWNYLDSPATTSATTYKLQFKNRTAASGVSICQDNSTATILLLEIGA